MNILQKKRNIYNWYDDICKYYNITIEQAYELSERKRGRKPSLPGSKTCQPVSGMTFEELWDMKPRETSAQIFEFYKDIGSWSSIRQSRYNINKQWNNMINHVVKYNPQQKIYNILEYGSGIGPISMWLNDNFINKFHFTLVDVPCECLHLARFKFNNRGLKEVDNFNIIELEPEKFPDFDRSFDVILMCDVLEHCDDPFNALKNVFKYSHKSTLLLENWVDHDDGQPATGCDLDRDKDITKKLISDNFVLLSGNMDSGDRLWIKK